MPGPRSRLTLSPGIPRIKSGIVYVRKTTDNPADRPVYRARAYLLARRFGFGFGLGVYGSGGLFSIVRSKLSVRLFASPAGRRSSLAISAARSAAVSGLRFAMVGV
jgi:hypothetical protein